LLLFVAIGIINPPFFSDYKCYVTAQVTVVFIYGKGW
jgi:hypothetical protein